MKILLATDGSPCSEAAVKELCTRPWPADSEVKIISAAHPSFPMLFDPFLVGAAAYQDALDEERKRAAERVAKAAEEVRKNAPALRVTTEVMEDTPKKAIIDEADRWRPDLILIGSHGYGPVNRFLLGSVSQAVALYAPCSVEIVRLGSPAT